MTTVIATKKSALIARDIKLLGQIRAYGNHVAVLRAFHKKGEGELPEVDAERTQFQSVSNEEFLLYSALIESEELIPGQLLALIRATPPVTFISVDLLTEEQIQHYLNTGEVLSNLLPRAREP